MNLQYGTTEEHLNTAKRAKANNITYVWSGDIRHNPYLAENLEFIQYKNLATVQFKENYDGQESGFILKWN